MDRSCRYIKIVYNLCLVISYYSFKNNYPELFFSPHNLSLISEHIINDALPETL